MLSRFMNSVRKVAPVAAAAAEVQSAVGKRTAARKAVDGGDALGEDDGDEAGPGTRGRAKAAQHVDDRYDAYGRAGAAAGAKRGRAAGALSGGADMDDGMGLGGGGGGGQGGGDEEIYCLCQQPAFGEMIGCDNQDGCQYEWFHVECVGLDPKNKPKGKWFCPPCQALGFVVPGAPRPQQGWAPGMDGDDYRRGLPMGGQGMMGAPRGMPGMGMGGAPRGMPGFMPKQGMGGPPRPMQFAAPGWPVGGYPQQMGQMGRGPPQLPDSKRGTAAGGMKKTMGVQQPMRSSAIPTGPMGGMPRAPYMPHPGALPRPMTDWSMQYAGGNGLGPPMPGAYGQQQQGGPRGPIRR